MDGFIDVLNVGIKPTHNACLIYFFFLNRWHPSFYAHTNITQTRVLDKNKYSTKIIFHNYF